MESNTQLRAVPFDIIPVDSGVLLSRGSVRFQLAGDDAEFLAGALADLLSKPNDLETLLQEFSEGDRPSVELVVDQLVERGLIIAGDAAESILPEDESPEDVFYWHFRETPNGIAEKLSDWTVILIGVNFLTTYILERLQRLGIENILLLDDPSLRNHRFFSVEGEIQVDLGATILPYDDEKALKETVEDPTKALLLACSDFGGARAFRLWNEFAIENRFMFLPAGMRGFRAEVGPLVRPDAGACYECYRARENANLADRQIVRAGEKAEEDSQGRLAGFVDPMLALVSGAVAIQVLKLTGNIALVEPSSVMYLSTMRPALTTHSVLRVPRCRVCSPTQWRPEVNLRREEFRAKLAREQH